MDLSTTNTMLGIMAAVSVLEAILLIAGAIAGFVAFRRVMQLVNDLELRHVRPVREKLDEILADVKTVTSRVNQQTERVDSAISETMGRVDETAERVRHSVRDRVSQATGVVRGIRAVVASVLSSIAPDNGRARSSGADGRI